jgi:hypothetical protein
MTNSSPIKMNVAATYKTFSSRIERKTIVSSKTRRRVSNRIVDFLYLRMAMNKFLGSISAYNLIIFKD